LSFHRHSHRVSASEAQGSDAAVDVAADHLVDQGDQHPSATGADGVTDGDGTSVDVDFVGIEAEFAHHPEGLYRECFVEFVEVDVLILPASLFPDFANRAYRSHHHPLRLDATGGLSHDADQGL